MAKSQGIYQGMFAPTGQTNQQLFNQYDPTGIRGMAGGGSAQIDPNSELGLITHLQDILTNPDKFNQYFAQNTDPYSKTALDTMQRGASGDTLTDAYKSMFDKIIGPELANNATISGYGGRGSAGYGELASRYLAGVAPTIASQTQQFAGQLLGAVPGMQQNVLQRLMGGIGAAGAYRGGLQQDYMNKLQNIQGTLSGIPVINAGTTTNQGTMNQSGSNWGVNILGGYSSARLKKDIAPLDAPEMYGYREAMAKVRAMPIVRYRYHWEGPESTPHIGPIAELSPPEIRKGPLQISLLDYTGLTHAAIKDVDRRLQRLEYA